MLFQEIRRVHSGALCDYNQRVRAAQRVRIIDFETTLGRYGFYHGNSSNPEEFVFPRGWQRSKALKSSHLAVLERSLFLSSGGILVPILFGSFGLCVNQREGKPRTP